MYKTLNKKIQELKNKKAQTQDKSSLDEIQLDIEKYQKEIDKKNLFFQKIFLREICDLCFHACF